MGLAYSQATCCFWARQHTVNWAFSTPPLPPVRPLLKYCMLLCINLFHAGCIYTRVRDTLLWYHCRDFQRLRLLTKLSRKSRTIDPIFFHEGTIFELLQPRNKLFIFIRFKQCSGSVTFWDRSGSEPKDLYSRLQIQIWIRLRILLFFSVALKMSTVNKFFFNVYCLFFL